MWQKSLLGLFLLGGVSCLMALGPMGNYGPAGYYPPQTQNSNTTNNQTAQAAQTLFQNVSYAKIAADAHVSTQEDSTPNLYGQADDESHRLLIKTSDADSGDNNEQ